MSNTPDARLQRLLGGLHLATLRQRLRRHFEGAKPGAHSTVLHLGVLSNQEYEVLAGLMGRPPRYAKSMRLDLTAIDLALRNAGIATSLFNALEQLDGPIVHLATARALAKASWSAAIAGCQHSGLEIYLETPAGLGLLKRLARQSPQTAARLRESADAVLQRLPANGLPRAQLAAETLGDAHALDAGQPVATLILAVLRQNPSSCSKDAIETLNILKEDRARDVWARVGVLVNELARPVLYLNLPTQTSERILTPGEPTYASLRMLLRSPSAWAVAGRDVFVCENPNFVAIASDQLRAGCAPLVCTDGMPAAAQRTLLTQLSSAGARLLFHGDFDWPGIRIANHIFRAHHAQPWRFGAADYEVAVTSFQGRRYQLTGIPVTASWDSRLMMAMQVHGLAIPEEGLAASLIQDLRT